jgi:hypothetical protein
MKKQELSSLFPNCSGEILNSIMKCPYGTTIPLPKQFKLPIYSYSLLLFKHKLAEYGFEFVEIVIGIQNHMMYSVIDALTQAGYKR